MTEVELKLAVPHAALPALRARLTGFGRGTTRRVDSLYFDTIDNALASVGAAVRLRRIGTRWVRTLKMADGDAALSARGEWEVAARPGRWSWARFPMEARRAVLGRLRRERLPRLEPRFRTRFQRTTWDVSRDGATIEVALDVGEIVAVGTRHENAQALCELELELKSGPPVALLDLAREIACPRGGAAAPLLPQPLSKAARGLRLAQGEPPAAAKADARRIAGAVQPSWTAAQALRSVLAAGSDALWINVSGALVHDDPEFVHQARVALRRMRSAIRVLRKDVAFPKALARELRWLGLVLGRVRDADVLALDILPARLRRESPGTDRWLVAARSRQSKTRKRMRGELAGPRCTRAALAVMRWVAEADPGRSNAAAPGRSMQDLAAPRLERVYRKLTTAARFFAAQSAERQHRVRILTKRLRYATDLFGSCLPGAAAARFSAVVEQAQDALGALNDARVAARAMAALTPHAHRGSPHERDAAHLVQLSAAADRAVSALLRAPVPWRKRRGSS